MATEEKCLKTSKKNSCSTCLGFLEKQNCELLVNKITEKLIKADYDVKTFKIAVTLPVTVQLRNYFIQLTLSENFPEQWKYLFPLDFVTVNIKDVWKWLNSTKIEKNINKFYDIKADFSINIDLDYEDNISEIQFFHSLLPKTNKKNREISRKLVEENLKFVDKKIFLEKFAKSTLIPNRHLSCKSINFHRESVYMAGRYNKYSRTLPQTPWILEGERKMENSVQELICEVIKEFVRADYIKFGSSGREDVDVRMLGNGRPFFIEIINAKRTIIDFNDMRKLEISINKSDKIAIRDLQFVDKSSLINLKEGEELKEKVYEALCVVLESNGQTLEAKSSKSLNISQKTPIRVLHRRSVASRSKTIHWFQIEPITFNTDKIYFKLKTNVQAGTYIKEFVHGDFGRTKPSLGDILGMKIDILALDVTAIKLDWPPSIIADPNI